MAYWDSKKGVIVYNEPKPCPDYPEWEIVDCGCCNGLEWGALEPTECSRCGGNGIVYGHIPSHALAAYPSGPFIGHYQPQPKC